MKKALSKKLFGPLMLLAAFSAPFAHAQDKALKKIIWGQTSISSSQWIPWIAKDAKIYEKYGLDVDIVYLRGGSGDTSKAIIAGSIFAAPVTTATVMTANLSGADLTTVAHTVKAVQSRVIAKTRAEAAGGYQRQNISQHGPGFAGRFSSSRGDEKVRCQSGARRDLADDWRAARPGSSSGGETRRCGGSLLSI